jgi:hypothetical protein
MVQASAVESLIPRLSKDEVFAVRSKDDRP